MINTIIRGVGMYLPEKVLTNDDISEFVDTSHEWIFERTGIRQRHIASKDQMTSDLAYMSALDAIQDANINATDIDLIILATSTPDQVFPSTAVKLQDMLNIRDGAAFDIHAVCSGFIYALSTADNFIKSGKYKRILVIGSEVYSRILNWKDRTTCVLFGDAAGAFILEGQNNNDTRSGIIDSVIKSDGQYRSKLYCDGGPSMQPRTDNFINMDGKEVYKHAVEKQTIIVEELLDSAGFGIESIDWFVPHQANLRILQTTAKKLKIKEEKIIVTVDKHANTSSASIPVAMTTAIKENKIKRGDMLLLEAFGAGFTWGAVLLRY
ncbi:MAG: beta-ketoacyl-ACP synthase III [Pseudomonadota bacterium]|nr:beta-ketoacyl-ACP synthase III [Pseudomonadota bacterium]MEC7090778.1 beta-ketoacyl-ACP synthase III [Pseudomonadota bacterium]MEC8447363.1 beta-ketoacyl-ACP synthase III [Pseudomonadota bacterium]